MVLADMKAFVEIKHCRGLNEVKDVDVLCIKKKREPPRNR
jgi:hypothetical protein